MLGGQRAAIVPHHQRQAATRQNQEVRAQLQQQQAEALEATRAIQKADAAAARRAIVEETVDCW